MNRLRNKGTTETGSVETEVHDIKSLTNKGTIEPVSQSFYIRVLCKHCITIFA